VNYERTFSEIPLCNRDPIRIQFGTSWATARRRADRRQVVNEAITHNLDFFAQKYDLSIAEAQIVTAKLRPNPLLTLDADHLDLLGTGFSLTAPPGKMPNNEDRKNMPVALTIFMRVAGSGRPAPYSQWEDVMSPVLDWPIPFVV
jgi:hypothetical protein